MGDHYEPVSVAGRLPLIERTDLRVGDLVFCRKASRMQWLLDQVEDPWRHVGLVVEATDGEPAVAEVTGAHQIRQRMVSELLDSYEIVAAARSSSANEDCLRRAISWARSWVGNPQLYAWDDVLLTGLILLTRRIGRVDFEQLEQALSDVAAYSPPPRLPSMTCSAFVFEAFRHAGSGCQLRVRLDLLGPAPDGSGRRSGTSAVGGDLGALLAQTNLYEVVASGVDLTTPSRGHRHSRISVPQLLKTASTVATLVEAYSKRFPSAGAVEPDGRWVSPGDLWRSTDLGGRAYLKVLPTEQREADR